MLKHFVKTKLVNFLNKFYLYIKVCFFEDKKVYINQEKLGYHLFVSPFPPPTKI